MVHVSMMRQILSRTDEQGDSRSRMSLAHIWTAIAVDASTIGHVGILDLHLRRRSQLPELSGEGGGGGGGKDSDFFAMIYCYFYQYDKI